MDLARVVYAKLIIICFFLACYNLFSCSVHATFTVTKILCVPSGMCGITFRYYNDMYQGFIVTNSTPPQLEVYYYLLSPRHHCYSPHGSLFVGGMYTLAALLLCCLFSRKNPPLPAIEHRVLEVCPGQAVSIGYDLYSKTIVIITSP